MWNMSGEHMLENKMPEVLFYYVQQEHEFDNFWQLTYA